jgi:diketogulonate reductase-like aldo/keto reductase
LSQVALRWIDQQGILFATAGTNPSYLKEDLHIFGFELSEDEMTLLSSKK